MYASILLAVFGGILLSAAWDSSWQTSLLAAGLSVLPHLWARRLSLPRQLGHSACGQALILVPHGLACTSEPYAWLLHQHSGVAPKPELVRTSVWGPRSVIGPLLALVLTPFLNHLFFPAIRVLNFTERTIFVLVDEVPLGRVEPTSGESPAAGELMRAPSGRHRIRATFSDGTVVSEHRVQIRSGYQHLYAPGARESCFYLQHISHGRSEFEGVKVTPLDSDSRFWVVPSEVDIWFSPERSLRRGVTTGGIVTALRMGNCR